MLASLVVAVAIAQTPPADVAVRPNTALASASTEETQSERAPNTVRARAWIPAVVGGVLALGGAAAVTVGALQTHAASSLEPDAQAARLDSARYNTVGGVALLGLGACVLGLSALMYFWTPSPAVSMSIVPGRSGATVVLGVRW